MTRRARHLKITKYVALIIAEKRTNRYLYALKICIHFFFTHDFHKWVQIMLY